MKRFFKFSIIIILIVTTSFAVVKVSRKYSLNILKDDIDCKVITKSCEKAKAIATDDKGNIYVAYNDYIKSIDSEGKEKVLYKNKDMSIEDIVFYNDKIIFISKDSIQSFSLDDGKVNTLYSGIPESGNNISRKLLLSKNNLLLSVGAVTNSGISEGDKVDLSPIDITLTGVNYGNLKTGAFKRAGEKSEEGEKIQRSSFGNACLYSFGLKKKGSSLYASGIRGITGMDLDSKGNIIAIFSGFKNEGLRPVNRDKDYIYKIARGKWYGWPDFSGGDPITSPRFKGNELVKALLKDPPSKVVESPLYQHETVDSLRELSIDINGKLLDKDSYLFWDRDEEVLSALSPSGVYCKILKLNEKSKIEDIIYNKDGFLILDSVTGCIYSIHEKEGLLGFKLPLEIWIFVFMLSFILLCIIVLKWMKKENKKYF
ncbi:MULTISPECIES: hypothetical protein [Clostridium]|uniref:Glucose / sorbosone dehydrogenase n=1 Tax=Clostridium cibarium TaxID=2762247 RepID=A0ABR8PP41_9CLOT|nr:MULTISPECIES: hypothetical protein [Clostridium]MBD7909950.1 hypothetical protein [Clostridium cibarium]